MFWDWDSIRLWIALLLEILIIQWYFNFERRCEAEAAAQRFMKEHEETIKRMCTDLCDSIDKEFDNLLEVREMFNNMLPYINRKTRRKGHGELEDKKRFSLSSRAAQETHLAGFQAAGKDVISVRF